MSNFFRRVVQAIGDLIWDARNGRFTRRDGSAVDPYELLGNKQGDVTAVINGLIANLMRTGDVNAWRNAFALELRRAIVQSYVLGAGGWSQITTADRVLMRQLVESEMAYLRQFALDIAQQNLTEGQIRARMEMYSSHLNRNYAAGERSVKEKLGYNEERRVLSPVENCEDCVGYANEGWQPLGYFPLPGEGSVCKANCRCTLEYR